MPKCKFCLTPVNPMTDYRKVTGWERKRDGGGTNALRLREVHDEWAHALCIDKQARLKLHPDQAGMF